MWSVVNILPDIFLVVDFYIDNGLFFVYREIILNSDVTPNALSKASLIILFLLINHR